jgi:hypothetical protein
MTPSREPGSPPAQQGHSSRPLRRQVPSRSVVWVTSIWCTPACN